MNDDLNDPCLRGIIRNYSLNIAEEKPDDILSQALGANARFEIAEEEWRREVSWLTWLSSCESQNDDVSLIRLENHKKQIAERWKAFINDHPKLRLGDIFKDGQSPPRIDNLLRAAQDAEDAWKRKKEIGIGKAKSAIENFVDTMSNHSFLFSVIPSDDKYTSIITGVMTSITKAFVNHKRIAELFSEALEKISKDLSTIKDSVILANPSQIKADVVDLYVAVFNLLCDAMNWYGGSQKRRLLGSLRQNYAEDIRKSTDRVNEVLRRIRHRAEQATQFRVWDSQQDLKDIKQEVLEVKSMSRNLQQLLAAAAVRNREDPTVSTAAFGKLGDDFGILILGRRAMESLMSTGEAERSELTLRRSDTTNGSDTDFAQHFEDRRMLELTSLDGVVHEVSDNSSEEMSDLPCYTREQIQQASAPYLQQYFEDGRSGIPKPGSSPTSRISLPSEVTQKIVKWITNSSSSFLWVEGPASYTPAERQLSIIAVHLCNSALNGEQPVPCVSFTPKSIYDMSGKYSVSRRQEKVLIHMLYSIAGQLVQLLPETLDPGIMTTNKPAFDLGTFSRLDGSFGTASAALDLIETLLAHGPPTLMVILNRVQVAECPTTTPHLQRLVGLLKTYNQEHIIKVLFITQGASPALAGTLDLLMEKVDARRMVQARPGQPPRGWSSLGHVNVSSSDSSQTS